VDVLLAEGITLESLDYIYESSDTFDEVYAGIAERIVSEAETRGQVVYAVPGHPLVGEASVQALIRKARERDVQVEIVGSQSFIEAALEALGLGLDAGLKVLDALSLGTVAPAADTGNLIYQVYDCNIASEVKLKLMETYPEDFEVTVISGAGTPGQGVRRVPLYQLDRCDCDHLTTVYVPPLSAGTASYGVRSTKTG